VVRIGLACVLAAGCGRIGFGPASSADAPGHVEAVADAQAQICVTCGSSSVTLDAVPPGSALVAFLASCGPTEPGCATPAIADALGQPWTGPLVVSQPQHGGIYTWTVCGAAGGKDVVTATESSGAQVFMSLHVAVVANAAQADCVGATGTVVGAAAPGQLVVGSASVVPRAPAVTLGFFFSHDGAGGTSPWTAGPGFTQETALVAPFGYHSTLSEASAVVAAGMPASAGASQTDATAVTQAAIVVVSPP
jgi:hypothetical protein